MRLYYGDIELPILRVIVGTCAAEVGGVSVLTRIDVHLLTNEHKECVVHFADGGQETLTLVHAYEQESFLLAGTFLMMTFATRSTKNAEKYANEPRPKER